jgi:hypothetical protein
MKARVWTRLAIVPLLLGAGACDRHNAPSDQLAQSARKIVGAATPTPVPLAQGPYAPHDTCHSVKGADEFRRQLADAVMARDANALLALTAADIKLDFGGGTGRAELKKRLTDRHWKLWDELDQLLDLGCAANQQGGITIPWYFEQHIDKVDAATGMLVTGENVPLFPAPDPKTKPIGVISWDVVSIDALAPDVPYQGVTTADGKAKGYIATDKLRSLLDYRMMATQRNGKWSIVSLVSGD